MSGNKTFTIIKPDAFQSGYSGPIIQKIEEAGFTLKNMRMVRLDQETACKFYAVHQDKPFFERLCNYMCSGPIIVMELEKNNAVDDFRKLIGATDPNEAEEGTIRADFAESKAKNAVHGSDSDENAQIEADFHFSLEERF